jgi:competence protein ComEC
VTLAYHHLALFPIKSNAFSYMARIWNALKGDLEHAFCDEVAFYMNFNAGTAKTWVSTRYEYAGLPGEWSGIYSEPDGKLHVLFLDVGQGDAILVVTPGGKRILIDGGPSPVQILSHMGSHLQVWDYHLEAIILSHADDDHIMGHIPVLDRYHVFEAFDSGYPSDNYLYAHWMGLVNSKGVTYHEARAGMTIDTNDGVVLTVLHPGPEFMQGTGADTNNNSVVVRLEYQDVSFLFTGDIEAEAEQALLDSGYGLESTVLKVSHHGAPEASTQEFLEAVNPEMAVISVGEDNWYGHPAEEVVERLEAIVGSNNLYRTDHNGTIEMTVEGELTELWFYPIQVIPSMPEEGEPPEEPTEKVNINTATQEELETLEAIGPKRAQSIIQYRPYESIEEILDVPGIGPLTYLKIKDFICVM